MGLDQLINFLVNTKQHSLILQVAKLYYYQGMTTEDIAQELGLSRPKVSRLLTQARQQGMVQIQIFDPYDGSQSLGKELEKLYQLKSVHTVPVPDNISEAEALERVAIFTGAHLNTLIKAGTVMGVAWGTTLAAISRHLIPQPTQNMSIVQLNGSGSLANISNPHINEVILRFGQNYNARVYLFPVPAFFDYASTKTALWKERSVKRILELQHSADIMLFSIGAIDSAVPGYVYSSGYLEEKDFEEIQCEHLMGDIATVFFRQDGSFQDIPLNQRASGPDLSLIRKVNHAVCVVAGKSKVQALKAALAGKLLNELIVDEPTARLLL
jgi:DNA-binding transcriptional regulator LsrR (DeoR family)